MAREGGELRRIPVGILPALHNVIEARGGFVLLPSACLYTTNAKQVTRRFPLTEACVQQRLGLVELSCPQKCLQDGILKHFPLGMASTDTGQLRVERPEEPRRLGVFPVGKGADALHQGQGGFGS